ncbi:MAG: sodium:solute symporter [Limisphaerales bacterium]
MSPALILACIGGYFFLLLVIAWRTGRGAGNAAYFLGNRQSPWYAVAFGLIGDSLSGVTFISVPGWVGTTGFSYLQMVFGYVAGYLVIAHLLLPLYYRLELTSIYSLLGQRLGDAAQRTGSSFFLVSRLVGAAARLYLAVTVLQHFVFRGWGVPLWVTAAATILLIVAYTYRGGIKTLVWTDTFQSAFLLLGLGLSVVAIAWQLGLGPGEVVRVVRESPHSRVFFWDWAPATNFWKQFIGGAFVAICMTGLDQNMMQKSLSCRSLAEAQRNIHWFAGIVVLVTLLFLSLGALLFHYAEVRGIPLPARSDQLFPTLALQHLGAFAAVVFALGLTAATFSSADSVLTTLTTSFCIDILRLDRDTGWTEARQTRTRHLLHVGFAGLLLLAILAFAWAGTDAIIGAVLKLANYTYGPLLGLFAFALYGRGRPRGAWVPAACLVPPVLCGVLDANSRAWLGGYAFGNELLVINGALTYAGLWLVKPRR